MVFITEGAYDIERLTICLWAAWRHDLLLCIKGFHFEA